MRGISLFEIREALKYGEQQGYTLFQEARDKSNIQKAKENPITYQIINDIMKDAHKFKDKLIIDLSFRRFIDFLENGNRLNYEGLFFSSKNELHTLVLAEILEDKGDFIESIEERLWAWCNEYSWELPAHVPLTEAEIGQEGVAADEYIALFAAETGFYFAEILSLLKGKLHPLLVYRIESEIDRRILQSYDKRIFKWEDWHMNWSAVCAGSIGCAAIYSIKDSNSLAKFIHRVIGSMDSYIEGFDKDGVTAEGLGYWQYGFSFYIYFAELLRERTGDKINLLLRDDKIRKIAELPLYLQFPNREMVNFSDAAGDKWSGEYSTFTRLAKTFNIENYIYPDVTHISWDHTSKWAVMTRNIFWNLEDIPINQKHIQTGCYYFEESQWLIDRQIDNKGRFSAFAAKGGNNDEPHNHNDLGHFILHYNGENVFCDLGAPEYVKEFFREKRYEFLHASSKGHSVPIINDHYQAAGKAQQCHVLKVETGKKAIMKLDLKDAYAISELEKYCRTFNWQADTLTLSITDDFRFGGTNNEVQEILMTYLQVTAAGPGKLKVTGEKLDAYISFDKEAICEIKEEKYKNHFSADKAVHRIIIKYPNLELEKKVVISIKLVQKQ